MTEINASEKIPGWLAKRLSDETLEGLRKIRRPNRTMADIPVEDLPAALVSLRAVADCIYGMCFQGEPERDLRMALRVIEHIQGDLDDTRVAVRAALLAGAEERDE